MQPSIQDLATRFELYCRRRGWADASVVSPMFRRIDGGTATEIVVEVNEGARYRVSRVEVGSRDAPERSIPSDVLASLATREGAYLDIAALDRDVALLHERMGVHNVGYELVHDAGELHRLVNSSSPNAGQSTGSK